MTRTARKILTYVRLSSLTLQSRQAGQPDLISCRRNDANGEGSSTMWFPGWISLPSPIDDDRSPDEDRKRERPGDRRDPAPDDPSEEDRSAFARLQRSGPERRVTSGKGETEAADAKAPEAKSGPESDEPDRLREDRDEPDTPRADRDERDRDRPSSRVGAPAPAGWRPRTRRSGIGTGRCAPLETKVNDAAQVRGARSGLGAPGQ